MYDKRDRYLRDRAQRRARRNYDYKQGGSYRMAYRYDLPEHRGGYDSTTDSYRYEMDNRYDEHFGEPYRIYDYNMRDDYRDYRRNYRGDYGIQYREDYAINGIGRPREYNRRDYDDEDYKKEYQEDLKKWIEKLKKFDRFGVPKDQIIQKAKEMNVDFKDYTEEEFYAIYLMHVSDYPKISTEPYTYVAMAKAWLEDKDLKIEPSEKVAKYMYEIVMAEED